MIECEITKISKPTPPSPVPSPSPPNVLKTVTKSITKKGGSKIKTITKTSIFNPASWPYKVKIAAIAAIAILILALFLRVRLFGKANLSDLIKTNQQETPEL